MEKKKENHIAGVKRLTRIVVIMEIALGVEMEDCINIRRMSRGGTMDREEIEDLIARKNEEIEELKEQLEKIKTVVNNSVLLTVNGGNFRCKCGANVFTEYDNNTFKCHLCGREYEGK